MCYNKAQVVRFTELTQLSWVGVLLMKILCVGVRGLPSGVESDLSAAKVFQDYDAAVVNPEDFRTLYYQLYWDKSREFSNRADGATVFQRTVWDIITSINKRRGKEVDGLLELGGILICFVQPLIQGFYYHGTGTYGTMEDLTNYDWLGSTVAFNEYNLKLGFGETIDFIDQGHPFAAYLKKKPSWTTFCRLEACSKWRVIASAFGTNAVALSRRQGRGHVVFLPGEYSVENGALLESCIADLLGQKEAREKPTWVREIFVPHQKQILKLIDRTDDKIEKLRKRKEEFHTSNQQLERWKWLLWETGKEYLEPVVREALGLIGCRVELQPDKDSDGKVDSDFGTALLEVGGGEGTIRRNKLRQLVSNIGNFYATREILPKGILVGNPFCKERPDNRPPKGTQKKLFANELIEDAEKQDTTVLLSTDLYCVVCGVLNGQVGEDKKKELRHLIFKGKGLVRLSLWTTLPAACFPRPQIEDMLSSRTVRSFIGG